MKNAIYKYPYQTKSYIRQALYSINLKNGIMSKSLHKKGKLFPKNGNNLHTLKIMA